MGMRPKFDSARSGKDRTMLANSNLVAFIATTDAERAKAFYSERLGLRLLAEEPYALVFDANGTTLRVQKVKAHTPLPYTALGWEVRGLAALVAQLADLGTRCERYPGLEQDEAGIWATPRGARVVWFKDPDGNLLSLTEF
jgi:catechol 2,3-dioxygenase-like lactoylglutathione lyase family enzyme